LTGNWDAITSLQGAGAPNWHTNADDPDLIKGLASYDFALWADAESWLWKSAIGGNVIAVFKLANVRSNQGAEDEAIALWTIASNQGNPGATNNLAMRLRKLGHRQEAMELYRIAAESGDSGAMFNLAIQFEDDGKIESARDWLQRSCEMGNGRACATLGWQLIEEGHREQGWEFIKGGIALGNLSACILAGLACMGEDDFLSAEGFLRQGFDHTDEPNEAHQIPRLWGLMGYTLYRLHRPSEAIAFLEQAHELGEENSEKMLEEIRREFQGTSLPGSDANALKFDYTESSASTAQLRGTSLPELNPRLGNASLNPRNIQVQDNLDSTTTTSNSFCTTCGTARQIQYRFCGNCGTEFHSNER
jgi:TPR repeat protein